MSLWQHIPQRVHGPWFGVTDANGDFSVVYPQAFPTGQLPSVQAHIITTGDGYTTKLQSSTETGFTVRVQQRPTVTILGVNVLSTAVAPVVGVAVNATAVSRP